MILLPKMFILVYKQPYVQRVFFFSKLIGYLDQIKVLIQNLKLRSPCQEVQRDSSMSLNVCFASERLGSLPSTMSLEVDLSTAMCDSKKARQGPEV